jgi:hypothetical protein
MMVISYWLGQKYYPVKYDMKRILAYMGLSAGLWAMSILVARNLLSESIPAQLAFNTVLLLIFVIFVAFSEPRVQKLLMRK